MAKSTWPWLMVGAALLFYRPVRAAVKAGVELPAVMKPTTARIDQVAAQVYARHGYDAVITSGLEGSHLAESKHYTGDALDFRVRDIERPSEREQIAAEIAAVLGPAYDVVLEPTHIHAEFDPA